MAMFSGSTHKYTNVTIANRLLPRKCKYYDISPSEAFEIGAIEEAVGYAATGFILHSGLEICRVQSFAAGDTVGVYLDMNTHEVAFFLNDEALLDPRETDDDDVTIDYGETAPGRVVGAGIAQEVVEMKAPAYAVNTRRVSWFSFQSRTVFATIKFSSKADNFVVMGSDVPTGYR
ncbi:unnamed protein product [Peronospora belbahrii]|uniref:B30.2/SPRY domain-containing protein n=1 Tax=Peronospora belbahrii TaxID=622444 RepID=A0AAU9KVU9_9STRA|nr:unnamed protein product [Peronospora belbahrii]CAH0519903.1 unnamed protein product [Peronospora belbahrii]